MKIIIVFLIVAALSFGAVSVASATPISGWNGGHGPVVAKGEENAGVDRLHMHSVTWSADEPLAVATLFDWYRSLSLPEMAHLYDLFNCERDLRPFDSWPLKPGKGRGDHGRECGDDDSAPQPVPEPTTMVLLGSGLFGMAVWMKRRRTA